jgi:hypothetical protein
VRGGRVICYCIGLLSTVEFCSIYTHVKHVFKIDFKVKLIWNVIETSRQGRSTNLIRCLALLKSYIRGRTKLLLCKFKMLSFFFFST